MSEQHKWSPAELRMFWRNSRRRAEKEQSADGVMVATTDPFLLYDRGRLSALAGSPCPVCRKVGVSVPETLVFNGRNLYCRRGHSYSNPGAAEEEVAELMIWQELTGDDE